MRKLAVNKIKQNVGFTFVELLTALLIVVMLSAVVAAGIPTAWRTYTTAVDSANAQVALTTTTTALRSELSMATEVEVVGNEVHYYTSEGYQAKLTNPGNGQIGLQVTYGSGEAARSFSLIPDASTNASVDANNPMHVGYDSVSIANGVITFNGLTVSNNGGTLASTGSEAGNSYKIRVNAK